MCIITVQIHEVGAQWRLYKYEHVITKQHATLFLITASSFFVSEFFPVNFDTRVLLYAPFMCEA